MLGCLQVIVLDMDRERLNERLPLMRWTAPFTSIAMRQIAVLIREPRLPVMAMSVSAGGDRRMVKAEGVADL